MATTAKRNVKDAALPQFNFRRLPGGSVVVTNDSGAHVILGKAEFARFSAGKGAASKALAAQLVAGGFVRNTMDFESYAGACAGRNAFLGSGPGLHILVLTLRCNHKCVYCQSSAAGAASSGSDMSPDTARRSVDFALKSTNPCITIEFQGGEPLLNWPALKAAVLHARARGRELGRDVKLALVSNFSLMTEEKARFLLENEVSVCTSLDGPAALHEKNRVLPGGGSHASAVRWLKYFSQKEKSQGERYRVFKPSALLTVSRHSLGHAREIVDEYLRLGLEDIFLRPIAPIGYAKTHWDKVGYSSAEFLKFYREALGYIIDRNIKGRAIRERGAVMMLEKILKGSDPGYLDMRCPCGAGIGQLAYNYNGDIYTCDEGRMVGWLGDELFRAGSVGDPYGKVMLSPVVRACAAASALDTQPSCSRCAYRPYCGICPVHNYAAQGSLSGAMPSSGRCAVFMGQFDTIFGLLRDKRSAAVLKGWVEK